MNSDSNLTADEIREVASQVSTLFRRPCDSRLVTAAVRELAIALGYTADLLDQNRNQPTRAMCADGLLTRAMMLHQVASALVASLLGSSDKVAREARVYAMAIEDLGDPVISRAELEVHIVHAKPVVVTLTRDTRYLWTVGGAIPIGDTEQVRLNSLLDELANILAAIPSGV